MKENKFFYLICFLLVNSALQALSQEIPEEVEEVDDYNAQVSENRLAAQVFAVLDHYKQEDPVGLPGIPVPDPAPLPPAKHSISLMGTLTMKDSHAYGLSKFRIKYIRGDLKDMKLNAGVQLDVIRVIGNYTMSSFLTKAEGEYSITLKNVFVAGNATLGVERNGKLRTQDIAMDITFSDMATDFKNLGFFGSIFQSVVNSAPTLIFDIMKPLILEEAYKKMRVEIDTQVAKTTNGKSFPNSVAPLDMAISEVRKTIRQLGYDPFRIPNYNRTVGLFSMEMSNTWITGLSSFYRIGSVIVAMENNTVSFRVHAGTQKIDGSTQWEVGMGKMIYRAGHAQFSIQHFRVSAEISQPLDTRKRSKINDLQLELGNIQVRCEGAGTVDYVLEFVVNVLPNLLRYQIMDAIENPIKTRVQERLDQIDVERSIKDNWDYFENMGANFTHNFGF